MATPNITNQAEQSNRRRLAYNDPEKVINRLIQCGNNSAWSREAVNSNIMYVNRVYGKITSREAADIISTIAEY